MKTNINYIIFNAIIVTIILDTVGRTAHLLALSVDARHFFVPSVNTGRLFASSIDSKRLFASSIDGRPAIDWKYYNTQRASLQVLLYRDLYLPHAEVAASSGYRMAISGPMR